MQALVKLIYPLIFILIFQSCKNITNSEEPKLISVFGTVSLTTETESFPLYSVVVIISDKSDTTDKDGNYRIENLSEGDYIAQVIYSELDTAKVPISVSSEQNSIEIPLEILPEKNGEDGFFGTIIYENKPVENVEIKVYDILNGAKILVKTGKTNSEGTFSISGLNKRLKEIHFTHEYLEEHIIEGYIKDMGYVANADCFDANSNEACVSDFKELEMSKNDVVSDYFPIVVGDTWNYEYKMTSNRANSWDDYSGEAEWSVISVNNIEAKSIYSIQEIFNGTYSITGADCKGNDTFDTKTVELKNDTLAFTIEIDELGSIYIDYPFRELGCADLGSVYSSNSNTVELNRYYSPLIGDKVELEKYGSTLISEAWLTKDKGLTMLSVYETPHNSGSSFYIKMKED